ncbi:15275_t:CDS:2, partial [Funneliformis geosporum]
FSDIIQSQVDDLLYINELKLKKANEDYRQTREQLMAEYVVQLNYNLRGEPEPFDKITSKCTDVIMKKYDQKIETFPKFITSDNRDIFKSTLISMNKEFRIQYDVYLKQYMDDFKKNVDDIYDNVIHEYKLKVNTKLPNMPMSDEELATLLYFNKDKYHSLFDSDTSALHGQKKTSRAYVQQRKNVLVARINTEQENMISYNKHASKECCNKIWDEKVDFIRDKVKNGNYDTLDRYHKDLNTFKNSYRLAASGPAINTIWQRRLKEINSWEANVRRSIMAIPHNGKSVETIYNDIMKSTLIPIDELAKYLGVAWAGSGHYRRTASGYMWVCTRKDVDRKYNLPSYVYDFKSNFKDLIASDPII